MLAGEVIKKMVRFWRYSEDGDWMSSPREKMSTREEAQGHLEFWNKRRKQQMRPEKRKGESTVPEQIRDGRRSTYEDLLEVREPLVLWTLVSKQSPGGSSAMPSE